jgi:outer membrane murein-binding lipoprotein Lpp
MKNTLATMILCAGFLLCGCSDSAIHVDKVRAAFQGIPADKMEKLETGLKAVESSNYSAALPTLQAFAFGTKMNDEQRKVMTDTIEKVSAKAGATK